MNNAMINRAVSIHWGSFSGCPNNKSPTRRGLYRGPDFGNSHMPGALTSTGIVPTFPWDIVLCHA